ncbi:hypothetical protein DPMN_058349 [Dreissena polymorpha]|uniref:Uncharacterized protein n=1 Tax=Dreissena polymorpha TaxID=45954 RepID=A0A9D4HDI7_DREPO|nr:hypothetical protein DPMN_058349 [Dreissena polymorpha]
MYKPLLTRYGIHGLSWVRPCTNPFLPATAYTVSDGLDHVQGPTNPLRHTRSQLAGIEHVQAPTNPLRHIRSQLGESMYKPLLTRYGIHGLSSVRACSSPMYMPLLPATAYTVSAGLEHVQAPTNSLRQTRSQLG